METGGKDMSGTLPAKCFLGWRKDKRPKHTTGICSGTKN